MTTLLVLSLLFVAITLGIAIVLWLFLRRRFAAERGALPTEAVTRAATPSAEKEID